jgi:hypothetical protein
MMNYIHHLNGFFARLRNDNEISAYHVSLYIALFQYWNFNRFKNPFPIYRSDIMEVSKIGSKNTYHKCIKELQQAGYIIFHPQISKYFPATISMTRFDLPTVANKTKQYRLFEQTNEEELHSKPAMASVPDLTVMCPKNGPLPVPNVGHLIKHNNKHINSVGKTHTIFDLNKKINEATNELAGREKNYEDSHSPSPHDLVSNKPTGNSGSFRQGLPGIVKLAELETFFQEHKYPVIEARKFFYYNEAKGWMLNEKAMITDWKSLAHKWMLKASETKQKGTGHLHTNNDKNYSEPL